MFMYTHFYISLTRPKFFAFKKTNQFDDKKMMTIFSFCLFYVPPRKKKISCLFSTAHLQSITPKNKSYKYLTISCASSEFCVFLVESFPTQSKRKQVVVDIVWCL